jgi:hypothetical protein
MDYLSFTNCGNYLFPSHLRRNTNSRLGIKLDLGFIYICICRLALVAIIFSIEKIELFYVMLPLNLVIIITINISKISITRDSNRKLGSEILFAKEAVQNYLRECNLI